MPSPAKGAHLAVQAWHTAGPGAVLAAPRHDATTASGHSDCPAPKARSARPACPLPVISSTANQATRASSTTTAPADTAGRRPHGTEGPRRHAPAGHATSAAHPMMAQIMCGSGKLVPGCSGLAATSRPATAPAIRISRPGARAGRSASPVTKSQPPTTRKASVITHRSTAPGAASALTVWVTGSNECWSPAATVHPLTISTGAAADEATPHHGTTRTTTTVIAARGGAQQPVAGTTHPAPSGGHIRPVPGVKVMTPRAGVTDDRLPEALDPELAGRSRRGNWR